MIAKTEPTLSTNQKSEQKDPVLKKEPVAKKEPVSKKESVPKKERNPVSKKESNQVSKNEPNPVLKTEPEPVSSKGGSKSDPKTESSPVPRNEPPIPAELPESILAEDSRHGLRRGRMIPCPLCGVEYAIASNLEKHIDRDHKDTSKPVRKRGAAPKKIPEVTPPKKMRKFRGDPFLEALRLSEETATVPITAETTEGGTEGVAEGGVGLTGEVERRKLTEYEIFQSLQLHAEKKQERRKVSCRECGKLIPPNNIKR